MDTSSDRSEPPSDFAAAFDAGATALADSIVGRPSRRWGRLLRDPVIAAAMAADGVRPEALLRLLHEVSAKLGLASAAARIARPRADCPGV